MLEVIPVNLENPPDYVVVDDDSDPKGRDREMFKFEVILDGRNQKWRGKDHSMSWRGGIF